MAGKCGYPGIARASKRKGGRAEAERESDFRQLAENIEISTGIPDQPERATWTKPYNTKCSFGEAMRNINLSGPKAPTALLAALLMLTVAACGAKSQGDSRHCPLIGSKRHKELQYKACYYRCKGKRETVGRHWLTPCPGTYPKSDKGRRVLNCYEDGVDTQSCLKKIEHLFR